MKKNLLLIVAILGCYCSFSQEPPLIDSFYRELALSKTIIDRMGWMRQLASYYTGVNNAKADSIETAMLSLADSSRDRTYICMAYLYNADRLLDFSVLQSNVIKAIDYSEKALKIARDNNLDEYMAWSYVSLSRAARTNGNNDKSLNYSNIAVSMIATIDRDSLKVAALNSLGNTYQMRNEKLLAFRQYLNALNIAEESNNDFLINDCYSRLSNFYTNLEDYEKAKDYLFKKINRLKSKNNQYLLIHAYNEAGQLYALNKEYDQALKFYEMGLQLADTINFEMIKLNGYILIVNLYLASEQFEKGLEYFNSHPVIKKFMMDAGLYYLIDQAYGSMYMFTEKLDSAGYFLEKARPDYERYSSVMNKYYFYMNYAYYFKKREDVDNAIVYTQKARELTDKIGNLSLMKTVVENLDSLYQKKGNYEKAYEFRSLTQLYSDSMQSLAREKDLLGLEIENENQRKERLARLEQEKIQRRHNIQYMGIVIAIAAIFVLLVMAGVFSVSKTTIKILGFFAFILLFEFIILLADNKIHHWTHGEPWKVLSIKIGLIAILLPLHHWLEEKVIHYLTTQELLRMKGKGLLGKWFRKKDADLPMGNL